MKTCLVFSPHADDAAAFCGGTLAKFSTDGWKIVLVRVTDDSTDSIGLTREKTKEINSKELADACSVLGISEIVDLNYVTDTLAGVPELELRERFVYLIRKFQPYAVFTFDPMGLFENNQDHVRVAEAVDEAFWVSAFDKHYPEHFKEGLEPFSVCERWYFGRQLSHPNHVEDITAFMEKKVLAMYCHKTMVKHMLRQYQMQLETWGKRVSWIDESLAGDHFELLATFLQEQGNAVAESFQLGEGRMAEVFRLERFGDLEDLFQAMGEPLSGAEIIHRSGMDVSESEPQQEGDLPRNVLPSNLNNHISIMGHHHLCAGAFSTLLSSTPFQLAYSNLVANLDPTPTMKVQTIFGYDVFCYECGYWDVENGRCSTGWKNKISKDLAVLDFLEIEVGDVHTLEELQRKLAEKITPEKLAYFCAQGEWKCENYLLGNCQKGYQELRERFGLD